MTAAVIADPYGDEDTVVSECPMAHLGSAMMREREIDPYMIYEPIKVLGTGSMGSVTMVRKRDKSVGGSARRHNLPVRTQLEMQGVNPQLAKVCSIPYVGDAIRTCCGLDPEKQKENAFSLSTSFHPVGKYLSLSGRTELSPTSQDDSNDSDASVTNQSTLSAKSYKLNISRHTGNFEVHYALKSIHLERMNDLLFVNEMKNEISLMKQMDHAHIVKPIETYAYQGHLYMVMELCSGGDLYSRDPYTEDQASRVIGNILSAIAYMHENNIIHRDLKYENVLFANNTPKAEIKLIDFGLSKKMRNKQNLKDGVGTIYTMSPEVLKGNYTEQADVWSVGILAYMLLSSQMPFYGKRRRDIIKKISQCEYDFRGRRWTAVSTEAKKFVSGLLQFDPSVRPSAEEATRHFWLNKRHTSSVRTATDDDMTKVRFALENYTHYGKLKKLALMIVAHLCTSEDIGFLRKAFLKFDRKKTGKITYESFKKGLAKYNFSSHYMDNLFKSVNLDGTGEIKYTEFIAATIEATEIVTEERVAEAFDRLDSDDSGYISFENLRGLLGKKVSDGYIEDIIREVDIFTKDNRISYEEFLAMWLDENENEWRDISNTRTVNKVIEDMLVTDSEFDPDTDSS